MYSPATPSGYHQHRGHLLSEAKKKCWMCPRRVPGTWDASSGESDGRRGRVRCRARWLARCGRLRAAVGDARCRLLRGSVPGFHLDDDPRVALLSPVIPRPAADILACKTLSGHACTACTLTTPSSLAGCPPADGGCTAAGGCAAADCCALLSGAPFASFCSQPCAPPSGALFRNRSLHAERAPRARRTFLPEEDLRSCFSPCLCSGFTNSPAELPSRPPGAPLNAPAAPAALNLPEHRHATSADLE